MLQFSVSLQLSNIVLLGLWQGRLLLTDNPSACMTHQLLEYVRVEPEMNPASDIELL